MSGDGSADTTRAQEELAAGLPAPLAPLARLAFDYRWSWTPGGPELFASLHPERWRRSGQNPIRLLQEAGGEALRRAAADAALVARASAVADACGALGRRPRAPGRPVAFFCAEYAIHASLPIYSGGLGALAGDLVKEAADRALPLVAIGLLYRQGYFHQRLDLGGWQHEYWTDIDPERLPAVLVTSGGEPVVVSVPFGERTVRAQIWRVDVGGVPLYLLDSDRPENAVIDRWITSRLYVADRPTRLAQYVLLGVGGVRALAALGITEATLHLNEGHAAFATLELARAAVAAGAAFPDALAAARERTVFTTHTPVLAGNERYDRHEVGEALAPLLAELGAPADQVLGLGATPADGGFGLTPFALRTSRNANAVSRRHGQVARRMWQALWPDRPVDAVPIGHVTNGVHVPTWMARPMRDLLARHLGADWLERAAEPATWAPVADIPDAELWSARTALRSRLVEFVRERSVLDRLARGDSRDYVEAAARTFEADVLTVGFARRIASYKRLDLLVRDPARALALLGGSRPLQIVIAGKAHPADDVAKRLLADQVFPLRRHPVVGAHVAFLEDYDLASAAELVAGCDVWVNLPRPPLEASGTSGMKAAMNGGLHLSILDGWWAEAWSGDNGWALPGEENDDARAQDERDAAALFDRIEHEVVPLFYDRDAGGLPRPWIARIKRSLMTLGPAFATARMVADYRTSVWR